MYVCICMSNMCVYVHTGTDTDIYVCVHVCNMYMYVPTCIHIFLHTCINTCTHACIHGQACLPVYISKYMHSHNRHTSESYYADTRVDGITWPEVMLHIILIVLTLGMQWCLSWCHQCHVHWHWHQWYHMTIKSWCTTFQPSWPKEFSGVTDNAVSIISPIGVTLPKYVSPHFDFLDLRNAVVSLMML